MSNTMNDNAAYLLDLTQDEITAMVENEETYAESPSEDEIPASSTRATRQTMQRDQALRSMPPTLSCPTKVVRNVDQTFCTIAEQRSKQSIRLRNETMYESVFSCKATCHQYKSYELLSTIQYETFDLNKLDIVLDPNSVLSIRVTCTLNGLDTLKYPSWIVSPLDKVMGNADFINLQSTKKDLFQYKIDKAFASSPLSYLLQKKVPHGVLEKLHVHLDWLTKDSVMFQFAWNHDFKQESISNYLQGVFTEILSRKTFNHYPLIFSGLFVKRLVPVISYLPQIAQSLQKIAKTSKDTCPENTFNARFTDRLKMIEKNMEIMRPHLSTQVDQEEEEKVSAVTNLTLGLYYAVAKNDAQNKCMSLPSATKAKGSPDAVEAVTKIWSVTTSSNPSSSVDE